MNGKKFIYFVFLICLIFLMGCKKQIFEKNKLVVWAMGEEGLKLKEIVTLFSEEYPDIEVEIQQIPWQAAHEKLVTAVVGKVVPDVSQMGTTWMAEFYTMNALENLDRYIETSQIVKPENFFKGSFETCEFEDGVYGIPWYVDVRVMFYRKDLFEEVGFKTPPQNWDELISYGKKLIKKENGKIKEYAYAFSIHWQDICPLIWQNEGEIIDVKRRVATVKRKEVKEAVEFFVNLHRLNLVPTGLVGVDLIHSFRTGFYKMFPSGPYMISILKQSAPEIYNKWDVCLMPKKKSNTSFVGGSNLVIFKKAKNKDSAWKFIEFLSRPDIQIMWYKITTDLPAVRSAWEDPIFKDTKLQVFKQQLEDSKSPPNLPEWEEIANILHRKIEEVILNVKSLDVCLDELEVEINSLLAKKEKK